MKKLFSILFIVCCMPFLASAGDGDKKTGLSFSQAVPERMTMDEMETRDYYALVTPLLDGSDVTNAVRCAVVKVPALLTTETVKDSAVTLSVLYISPICDTMPDGTPRMWTRVPITEHVPVSDIANRDIVEVLPSAKKPKQYDIFWSPTHASVGECELPMPATGFGRLVQRIFSKKDPAPKCTYDLEQNKVVSFR